MPWIDLDLTLVEDYGIDDVVVDSCHYEAPYNLWFAWRVNHWTPAIAAWFTLNGLDPIDIRNGVFWTPDGSHIVSLAKGTSLHMGPDVDWELLVTKGDPDFTADSICCHDSYGEAIHCVRLFVDTGLYCSMQPVVLDEGFED